MADRINTPFTNEHFAEYCKRMVGQPYWYGTCGYKATSSLLTSKTKQYPSHYGSDRTSRYKQDIAAKKAVADCIGGAKGYAWTGGGQAILDSIGTDASIPNKYGSNNCPDKGADSMFSYAKSKGCAWGSISTLPEIVGLALHKSGHVGYDIGNGYAIEWRGFAYGCVKTKVSSRGWQSWYELPFIDYGDGVVTAPSQNTNATLGSRLLKKGSTGSDVKALQELLMQLGFALPKYGADGDFGSETETAVKAFQKAAGLNVDGQYGEKTHAALMDAIADVDAGQPDKSDQPEQPEVPAPETRSGTVTIISNGGKVNIRKGPGTGYGSISQVAPGTTFEYVATAANGWHAVVIGSQVGWVSGTYSKAN